MFQFRCRNSAGVILPSLSERRPYCTPTLSQVTRASAVGVDAVDVAQVVVVGPADRGDVALRLVELLVRRLAVQRVHRQRRQAAPGRDALGRAHGRAVAQRRLQRRQRIIDLRVVAHVVLLGVHADEPGAVLGGAPLRVRAVGGVHVVLEQFAVADVDGLRDHVGVALHRQQAVEHARVVLRDQVLLDRTARAAQAHGVQRHAVALDEALLGHHRGLAGQVHVVVGAGVVAAASARWPSPGPARRGSSSRCAPCPGCGRSPRRPGTSTAACRSTGWCRPWRRRRRCRRGRQHRDAVQEAVDRPELAAHDEVHRAAVGQRHRAHVGRPRAAGGQRLQVAAAGGAVPVGDERVDRTVAAVADDVAAGVGAPCSRVPSRCRPAAGGRPRPGSSCRRTASAAGR